MRECDLVMKGGITSGVVYPRAVAEIAAHYRLRSIGGTSAGAIAAAFAAAAEYRRQTSPEEPSAGFAAIEAESQTLARSMKQLFQPAPEMRRLYDLMIALVTARPGERARAARWAVTCSHSTAVALTIAGTSTTVGVACMIGDLWLGIVGLLVGPLLLAAWIGWGLCRDIRVRLPANDFGLCPGLRQGDGPEGLTDWMCKTIQTIAGKPVDEVLTIGDLKGAGIELAAMTTDLSSRRPFQLPLVTAKYWFSEREFRRLFPAHVVERLKGGTQPLPVGKTGAPADLHPLPVGDAFPVVAVARMSLSFPGLISAVPLWRFDDGLRRADGATAKPSQRLRRCLFSDGGISSNFPIHFFDALLPSRPTFGISLTDYEEARHGSERVVLPSAARQTDDLPARSITSLSDFAMAIVDTAKDWQDTLQAMSTGYAERIVEVRLDPKSEGGLNLAMGETTIERLGAYGREAGQKFAGFDFDEHRWRRALTVMPSLEKSFEGITAAWDAPAQGEGWSSLATVLSERQPKRYAKLSATWRRKVLRPFVAHLAADGRQTRAATEAGAGKTVQGGKPLPSIDAHIRLVADADRRPRMQEG